MRFIFRRFGNSIVLLIGSSMLAFLVVGLTRGDYFDVMRLDPAISANTVEALRLQHGLNRPLAVRYVVWLESALRGEGGFSFAYNSPAGPIIWPRARNTLLLTASATSLAWVVSLIAGVWAAVRPGIWTRLVIDGSSSILLAVPELVLALLLLLFAVRTGFFPTGGMMSAGASDLDLWARMKDLAAHLVLPALCLAAGLMPFIASHIRAALSEVLKSPFITAAEAHGLSFSRIVIRHALPAAANPLISLLGISIGLLISSSLLVEAMFSWPGVGQLLLEAILRRDFFLVIDSTVLATAFLIAGNLIADVLLYATDPRIRAK